MILSSTRSANHNRVVTKPAYRPNPRWWVGAAAESGKAQVSETIPESAQDVRIAHHLDRLFLLLTRYPPRQ